MTQPKPIIVQSDYTLLLEINSESYVECRDFLASFAEIVKAPEHIHTYQITPVSIWNASSTNVPLESILNGLKEYSRYEVPTNVIQEIKNQFRRFGILELNQHQTDEGRMVLFSHEPRVFQEIVHNKDFQKFILGTNSNHSMEMERLNRGTIKQKLIEIGYPVKDNIGFEAGTPFPFSLRSETKSGKTFSIRNYQNESTEIFYQNGAASGGHGVIVLPCGSGKTIVGINTMHRVQQQTLIVTTNIASVHQWIDEILDKTEIKREDIGEYSGYIKEIKPITVATYQILISRKSKTEPFTHFSIFHQNKWGLIIYDEVHLLPSPIFRITAEIQACRRLGLTATLLREDGKEKHVFVLIGPKRYDIPWKELERKGWIAEAFCHELRVPMKKSLRLEYIRSSKRSRFRIASENPLKEIVVEHLIHHYRDQNILIIGQYIGQLERLSQRLNIPIITGKTSNEQREVLYHQFRQGTINCLIVSKVANFSIDLPDASVALQISGTFGSRQEEAQRLGRILRPKNRPSFFYTLVSEDTSEQEFSLKRQMFLVEQGYHYAIEKWHENDLGVSIDDLPA